MSAEMKRIEKKLDKVISLATIDDWENKEDFMKRTGMKTDDQLAYYRKKNIGAWKKGPTGFIYSKSRWFESFKDLKEMNNQQ